MCIAEDVLLTGSYDRTLREYKISKIEEAVAQSLVRQEEAKKRAYAEYLKMKAAKKKAKKKKRRSKKKRRMRHGRQKDEVSRVLGQ